ncbi:hypothetical protein BDZ45DRAFT_229764 [Acephala macrosclerotiorum]|nr:hypothetical protein BDZ45DRAFT_229764 [Acephala macrosclerotiorum]
MGSPLAKVRAELLGNWLHNDKCIPMGIDASGRQSYHSILNGFHAFDSQPNITLFPLPLSEFRTSETSATTREPEPIYPSDGEVADSEASDDGKKSRVKLCTGGTSPTGSKGGSPAPSAMADFGELAGPEVVGISPKAQPAVETVVKKRCIIFMCGPKNAVDSEPKPAVPVVSQATPVAQKTPNKAPQPQKYTTKFACPGSKPLEKASNTVVYTADSEVTTAEVDVEGHDDSGREVVPSSDTELTRSIQTHKRHKRIVAPAESSRITRPIPEKESVVAPNLEQQKLRDVGLVNGTDLVTDGIALHERARREVGACFNCWIQKSKVGIKPFPTPCSILT